MTLDIKTFIPGYPVPAARPRRAKNGHFYTPRSDEMRAWQAAIWDALLPLKPGEPLTCAIVMAIVFFLPRPKSHYRANGEIKERYLDAWPMGRDGDVDNLTKAVMDMIQPGKGDMAGKTVPIIADDKQVAIVDARKVYVGNGMLPGAWVEIREAPRAIDMIDTLTLKRIVAWEER